jgi:hypothetical protein
MNFSPSSLPRPLDSCSGGPGSFLRDNDRSWREVRRFHCRKWSMGNDVGWSVGDSLFRRFRFENNAIGQSVVYGHNKPQHKSHWNSLRRFGVGHGEVTDPSIQASRRLKYHDEGDGAWRSGRTTTKVTRKEKRRCEAIQGTETEYEADGKNSWAGLLGARRK